ncbi:MAG: acetylxylan esterase [Pirellulales bacterium]|nr:acetylxylan esterase [Pirellulales bacterium]
MALCVLLATFAISRADDWDLAGKNGERSQRMIIFCSKYVRGWMEHADPQSGLLPRTVLDRKQYFWNNHDCAADNYPFITLTGEITGNHYTRLAARHILAQEQSLCNRVGALPDEYDFLTQRFRHREVDMQRIIFGASEYCKDGLMPISEQIGPSPWLDRMQQLTRGIWASPEIESPAGLLPTTNFEVNGDLLQVLSRLYWLTGDPVYKEWCFRLADYYLLHEPLTKRSRIPLRDHGCEVIGGLSEAYLIASKVDPERHEKYRPQLYALLDLILKQGVNQDGLLYGWFDPATGEHAPAPLSDGLGYVYNAFLTVALVDGEERYREAVEKPLSNLHKYPNYNWSGSVDEIADVTEGAINLLNRLPIQSGFDWVDAQSDRILERQQESGILEGWYGDGNSARTLMMVALWKTQGVTASPWRNDLQLGAVRRDDGSLLVSLKAEKPWSGTLRFDRPRHRHFFHMPIDYPRINQFPEWFTVELGGQYEVQPADGKAATVEGKQLLSFPVSVEAGKSLRLVVARKALPLRTMQYKPQSASEAKAWQNDVRAQLLQAAGIGHRSEKPVPLEAEIVSETAKDCYLRREVRFNSTPQRRIDAVLTIPNASKGPFPCVVCIAGHGGDRFVVYDPKSLYRGFAEALAKRGAITIAIHVSQHELQDTGCTLIGERLWDLKRCIDYVQSLPEADSSRIGCAGLSLGGEMAMWLAATDERIAATVSSGYLTYMDKMEIGHCMCWKFPGLRELVDWPDVYSLIAPRPLLCQNGLQEPPAAFNVSLARQAISEVKTAYNDFGQPDHAELCIHREGHVIDLPSLLAFFHKHLGVSE